MARCYICAGEHEGAKRQCVAEDCGKKTEPCEHHAAKFANCRGTHVATSRKYPERFSIRRRRANDLQNMRSSPPMTDNESSKDHQSKKGVVGPQLDVEQNGPLHAILVSSDMSTDDSLPEA
jgi:hypothetical protein